MYVIATNGELGEHYLTKESKWSSDLGMADLYEYMAEMPPLESELEYIVKVEWDEHRGLYKVDKN